MSGKKPNRLIHATSPYLLQHAYNPVDWYEWSPETFAKARNDDKPVLVSIGYSSCHWCHVMERESFENEKVAALMNEHFVCIKVDREERPDVDQVYMEAVQAMGIHGGWPLNVFVTPDQAPFYGGTYFPAKNWVHLLEQIHQSYRQKRNEINDSASQLTSHINLGDVQRFSKMEGPFTKEDFDVIARNLESKYDEVFGGLDKAPKFVMPTLWMWLLRNHNLSGNKKSLDMVLHTLRCLACGGIYDQIGGGFARYSVDSRWFAPHFEKMLYDNAQLMSLYAEAYRVVPDHEFKKVIYETVEWLKRDMLGADGGFYSALDADSEGEEGKYYTWTIGALKSLLGEDFNWIADLYHITEDGNWENGGNILYRDPKNGLRDNLPIDRIKSILLGERRKRIPPSLDDKVLLGWNCMMIQGLLDAFNAIGDSSFLELAERNMTFLEKSLIEDERCYRVFKGTEGFLEDYAFLIRAYIALYQATFSEVWLQKAEKWCTYVVNNFYDATDGYFNFTGNDSEKLIARKKEVFDNVIPSSNSMMGRNLFLLGTLLDNTEWKETATRMVTALKKIIVAEPAYNSNWAMLAMEVSSPFAEIAITGPDALKFRHILAQKDIPFSLFTGTVDSSNLPLLRDKKVLGKTTIYTCYNNSCKAPVFSPDDVMSQLKH